MKMHTRLFSEIKEYFIILKGFFFLLNKENYHTPETILLLNCL